MKNVLLALVASSVIAAALPAAAADGTWNRGNNSPSQGIPNGPQADHDHGDHDRRRCDDDSYQQMQGQLQRLSDAVRRGGRDGSYTKKSVRNFNREIGEDQRSLESYRRSGNCFDSGEVDIMRGKIRSLMDKMHYYDETPGHGDGPGHGHY